MVCPSVYLIDPLVQLVHCYVHSKLVPPYLSFGQVTKMTRLVKDHDPKSSGIFHSHLQNVISLLLTDIATNDAALEGGTLIRIQLMV